MPGNPLQSANMEAEMMDNNVYGRDGTLSKKAKRTKVTDTRLSPRASKPNESMAQFMGKPDLIDHTKAFEGKLLWQPL